YFIRKSSFAKDNYLYEIDDYSRYNFSLRGFDSLEGIKFAGITLLVTIGISYLVQIVFKHFNIPIEEQEIVKLLKQLSLVNFIMLAVSGLLVAPIVEELVFRWFLFSKLLKHRLNVILAAVISSIIFSAGHLTLAGFLPIFALAMINCYIIEKKGYWYAVFNHFFFNFLSFFSLFIQRFGSKLIK
ncbi:MAG: CPBP family intramembrane metalloprotease, partial [Bacillota bacterium]|nr:CPBP family intramembrane metalloprotease [Bacillota bacterium]